MNKGEKAGRKRRKQMKRGKRRRKRGNWESGQEKVKDKVAT